MSKVFLLLFVHKKKNPWLARFAARLTRFSHAAQLGGIAGGYGMAERSFAREVQDLRLGAGDIFRGEGILAVTKALLQSGVGYVAGYQGAVISHLMDVLSDAQGILGELGVHFESSASEAAAASSLAASVNYPIRDVLNVTYPLVDEDLAAFCAGKRALFALNEPFNIGSSTMGYGLGASSAAAFQVPAGKRALSVMGDGGFWHNGLVNGVGNAVYNKHDSVTVIVDNHYSAVTGKDLPNNTTDTLAGRWALGWRRSAPMPGRRICGPGSPLRVLALVLV